MFLKHGFHQKPCQDTHAGSFSRFRHNWSTCGTAPMTCGGALMTLPILSTITPVSSSLLRTRGGPDRTRAGPGADPVRTRGIRVRTRDMIFCIFFVFRARPVPIPIRIPIPNTEYRIPDFGETLVPCTCSTSSWKKNDLLGHARNFPSLAHLSMDSHIFLLVLSYFCMF